MEKKILATVGEKEITNLDVENALKSVDPYQAMHFQTEEGKKQLLEDLVNQELFYMQAKEDQLHNDEDFRAEMKKIEENMLKQYAINKVLSNVTLTEEEKKAFFEANKSKFNKPESASAKHILVDSEEAVFNMKNGEVSGPVKTQFGYHLIKLENLQAGGESEYEEVRNEIERSLMYQKQSEAYNKELNNLKSKYNDTVKYHA